MGGADLGVLSFYSEMSDAAGGDSSERGARRGGARTCTTVTEVE